MVLELFLNFAFSFYIYFCDFFVFGTTAATTDYGFFIFLDFSLAGNISVLGCTELSLF